MTVNEIIITALEDFGDPVRFGEYIAPDKKPKPDRYYTFNYSKRGVDYGDDIPGHEMYFIQVHFFCSRTFDSSRRISQTQKKLFATGFSWPAVINASDEDGQHIVFECEYADGSEIG